MVLLQKQAAGWYHSIAYGSRALTSHEKNTKLQFLALKWAIIEYFKEYLLYQSFVVWVDHNPLMYIMSTPNLNAMGHQWVVALAQFNFEIEYQKGHDNITGDMLSQVTTQLDPESEINPWWSHVRSSTSCQSPWPSHVGRQPTPRTRSAWHCQMPIGGDACHWLGPSPERRLNVEHSVGLAEDTEAYRFQDTSGITWLQWGKSLILHNRQNFTIHQEALYLYSTPKGKTEDLLLFVVPKAHCVATPNRCHWDVGHQGHNLTLSLLQECFW